MKNAKIWYLIGFVVVLGLIWFFFQSRDAKPEAVADEQNQEGAAMADWQSYINTDLHFSIKHPAEVKVYNDAADLVGLRMMGATQSEGTEMTDGLSVSFRKVSKAAGDSLLAIAQSNLDQIAEVATVKQAPASATLAGKSGVMYKYSAMGDFTVYLVPVSDTQILEVAYMVADPANQGFMQKVLDMLGTLSIN